MHSLYYAGHCAVDTSFRRATKIFDSEECIYATDVYLKRREMERRLEIDPWIGLHLGLRQEGIVIYRAAGVQLVNRSLVS